MTNITIELPEDYAFTTKVNSEEITYLPQQAHQSYLLECLEVGMRRYANDRYAGEKGQTKFDLCQAVAKAFNSGEELVKTRRSGAAKLPDAAVLAIRNAKADLMLAFKRITGKAKIADMLSESEAVAKYFDAEGVWQDDKVIAWIDAQREAGKTDYMAIAEEKLAVEVDIEI